MSVNQAKLLSAYHQLFVGAIPCFGLSKNANSSITHPIKKRVASAALFFIWVFVGDGP
jgi:hypothetical protein